MKGIDNGPFPAHLLMAAGWNHYPGQRSMFDRTTDRNFRQSGPHMVVTHRRSDLIY
jgi:hypothetical protein